MNLNTRVKKLLQAKESLRDSDQKLILAVWILEGLQLTEEQRNYILDNCSIPESITRARRDVTKEFPELKGSKEVEDKRKTKEERYRSGDRDEVSHDGYEIDYEKGVVYRV